MRRVAALLLLAGLAAGCSGAPSDDPAAPSPNAEATPTNTRSPTSTPRTTSTATPTATPTPTDDAGALPAVHHPVSLPALMRQQPDGGRPRILTTERYDGYTRHEVTYRSDDRSVSGVLFRPSGRGPFPGIVLNHGYIDPDIYVTGQGLRREQIALASAGYVVLHTDYRGHAAGDPAGPLDRETRLGYVRDAANAVVALTRLPYVDDDRLAMLGRSMGGGVTQGVLVAYPGLVDAAVIYASVSSRFLDNLRHFTLRSRPEAARELYQRMGTPRGNPRFYRELSPRTYFDRISDPVLALHGELDGTCPPRWARQTQALMREAEVDSELVFYPGEDHTFYALWQRSMDRTLRFLRARL